MAKNIFESNEKPMTYFPSGNILLNFYGKILFWSKGRERERERDKEIDRQRERERKKN